MISSTAWGNRSSALLCCLLGSVPEDDGGSEEDEGQDDKDNQWDNGWAALSSWLVDNHWVLLLDLVDNSIVTLLAEVVICLPLKLLFESLSMLGLNWENVVDDVPVKSLRAWWGGQRSSVGESWVVLDGVQKFANWHTSWFWVFLRQFKGVKEWVDIVLSEGASWVTVVVFLVKQDTNDSVRISIVFLGDFVNWFVDKVDLKIKVLSVDGVLRL